MPIVQFFAGVLDIQVTGGYSTPKRQMKPPRCFLSHALVWLFLSLVCLGQAASTQRYKIVGKVIANSLSATGIATLTVSLSASAFPAYQRAQVDGDGNFGFKNLQSGSYTLILRVPGAGSARQNVEVGPTRADSRGQISTTLVFTGNGRQTRFNVTSVRRLSIPQEAVDEYQKGLKHLENQRIEKALQSFQKTIEIAPQHASARNRVATIQYQRGEYGAAEKQYRTILEQRPNYFAALINLGGVLLAQGRHEESLEINFRALEERSDEPLVQAQIGYCFYNLGEFDKSEQYLKRAKELEPGHFSFPQLLLAEIYSQRRDLEAGIRELEEFLRLHPDSTRVAEARDRLGAIRNQPPRP